VQLVTTHTYSSGQTLGTCEGASDERVGRGGMGVLTDTKRKAARKAPGAPRAIENYHKMFVGRSERYVRKDDWGKALSRHIALQSNYSLSTGGLGGKGR